MIEATEEIQPMESLPSTIVVLRLGTLGDALLTTPLYSALRRTYPEAHLSVITSEWNAVVAEHHPAVDEVIPIPSGIGSLSRWLRTLAGRRFDLYIDPKDHRSTTSRMVAEFVRAKRKLVNVNNMPMFSGAEIVPPATGSHFVYSALAPMMILAPEEEFDWRPSVQIPESAVKAIEDQIGPEPGTYIVVNVSAGSATRRWPEGKWRAFVESVEWNDGIMIISSPGDAAMGERVASVRLETRYIPTDSLLEAAALVEGSHGLITSDTSIVHIASALNKPVLALYFNAPLMLEKFAPLSDVHHVVLAPDEEPVEIIDVDEVLQAASEMLREIVDSR